MVRVPGLKKKLSDFSGSNILNSKQNHGRGVVFQDCILRNQDWLVMKVHAMEKPYAKQQQ